MWGIWILGYQSELFLTISCVFSSMYFFFEVCLRIVQLLTLSSGFCRSDIIKMFSPFGKIIAEDFLWHTRGPKRGEPRGYAFVQYTTKEVTAAFISCGEL